MSASQGSPTYLEEKIIATFAELIFTSRHEGEQYTRAIKLILAVQIRL